MPSPRPVRTLLTCLSLAAPLLVVLSLSHLLTPGSALAHGQVATAADQAEHEREVEEVRGHNLRMREAVAGLEAQNPAVLRQIAERRRELLSRIARRAPRTLVRELALVPAEREALPAVLQSLVENWTDDDGELIVRHIDHGDGHSEYDVKLGKNGRETPLFIGGGLGSARPGDRIHLRGLRLAGESTLVSDQVTPTSAAPGAGPIGTQRTAVILVSAPGAGTHPFANKTNTASIFFPLSPAATLRGFYEEASYGLARVTGANSNTPGGPSDVYGPYTLNTSTCDPATLRDQGFSKADPDLNFNSYDRIVFSVNDASCGNGGVGTVRTGYQGNYDGAFQYLSISWNFNTALGSTALNGKIGGIALHEYGHNLGVWHANALECGGVSVGGSFCSSTEYADPSDVMGSSAGYGQFSAAHKDILGWFSSSARLQDVTTNGSYTLNAYETGADDVKTLRIPRTRTGTTITSYYYLEYRKPSTTWNTFATERPEYGQGVLVHVSTATPYCTSYCNPDFTGPGGGGDTNLVDTSPTASRSSRDLDDAPLSAGESYVDTLAGVTIAVPATTASSATVSVTFGQPQVSVQVVVFPATGGAVSGIGPYLPGQLVSLVATPAAGYRFVEWRENRNSIGSLAALSFTAVGDRMLEAVFERTTGSICGPGAVPSPAGAGASPVGGGPPPGTSSNGTLVLYDGTTPHQTASAADLRWTTIVCEDFQGTWPSGAWSTYSQNSSGVCWDDVNVQGYLSTRSAWAAAGCPEGVPPGASAVYPNNVESWMRFGPFDLSDAIGAEVRFRVWHQLAAGDNFVWVGMRNCGFWGGWIISGNSTAANPPQTTVGWNEIVMDFAEVPGMGLNGPGPLIGESNVCFGIRFFSDATGVDNGPFVDDVIIQKLVGVTTPTPPPSNTPMPSVTPTSTMDATATASVTASSTVTRSITTTPSVPPSQTGTRTASPTGTPAPTGTRTPSPTTSRTATISPTTTFTAIPTHTPSRTPTPSAVPTSSPSATATSSPTVTSTPTRTSSPTRTATETLTPTRSSTATRTPSPTPTQTNTSTPSPTRTSTATATTTRTSTQTATPSPTRTASPTGTSTASPTSTSTPSAAATSTPSPTSTAVPSATHTASPTETITVTSTSTGTATPGPTASSTRTPGPTATRWPGGRNRLRGTVALEGRSLHSGSLAVAFYAAGVADPVFVATPLTDAAGAFVVDAVPDDTFRIQVKHPQTMSAEITGVTFGPTVSGLGTEVARSFGLLHAGDANDDDRISAGDFTLLKQAFGQATTCASMTPIPHPCADFDASGVITPGDFTLLKANFGQVGPTMVLLGP
jgi:hypothetical protein